MAPPTRRPFTAIASAPASRSSCTRSRRSSNSKAPSGSSIRTATPGPRAGTTPARICRSVSWRADGVAGQLVPLGRRLEGGQLQAELGDLVPQGGALVVERGEDPGQVGLALGGQILRAALGRPQLGRHQEADHADRQRHQRLGGRRASGRRPPGRRRRAGRTGGGGGGAAASAPAPRPTGGAGRRRRQPPKTVILRTRGGGRPPRSGRSGLRTPPPRRWPGRRSAGRRSTRGGRPRRRC